MMHFKTTSRPSSLNANASWPSSDTTTNKNDKKNPLSTCSVRTAGLLVKSAAPSDNDNKASAASGVPVKRHYTSQPGLTAKNNVRHFVLHNYHCHANELPPSVLPSPAQVILQTTPLYGCGVAVHRNTKRRSAIETFPHKLFKMLEAIESSHPNFKHIVSWQPHGRSFCIHKPKTFVTDVMPLFFKQTKLTSFQRQLNLYGFERLTRGADSGGYYHELFLRDREFLIDRMQRTKVKGTGYKAAASPDSEPNFYEMPFVQPLSTIIASAARTTANMNSQDAMLWCDHADDIESALARPQKARREIISRVAAEPESFAVVSSSQRRHCRSTDEEDIASVMPLPVVSRKKDWRSMAEAVFSSIVVSSDEECSESEESSIDECDILLMNMPYDSSLDNLSCLNDDGETQPAFAFGMSEDESSSAFDDSSPPLSLSSTTAPVVSNNLYCSNSSSDEVYSMIAAV